MSGLTDTERKALVHGYMRNIVDMEAAVEDLIADRVAEARRDTAEQIAVAIEGLTSAGDLTDEPWDNGYRVATRQSARIARDIK